MQSCHTEDYLTLYGISSRVDFSGTARESPRELLDATLAAEPALLKVSLRRQSAACQTFWGLAPSSRPVSTQHHCGLPDCARGGHNSLHGAGIISDEPD